MWGTSSLCKSQKYDLPVIPLKLLCDADEGNSGVNLPACVKMGTGAGLWTHQRLHPNSQEGPLDKAPHPHCPSRQISSFASLWPATANTLLQPFFLILCHRSAEKRFLPCHHLHVFSGGGSTRGWLQPRQYNPRKTTCAAEQHTNISLKVSNQDRPSFLQAPLRQSVLGEHLQGKQPQHLQRGSSKVPQHSPRPQLLAGSARASATKPRREILHIAPMAALLFELENNNVNKVILVCTFPGRIFSLELDVY